MGIHMLLPLYELVIAPPKVLTRFEYHNTGDTYHREVYGTRKLAQTFTPQISHEIAGVWLKLSRNKLVGVCSVGIDATETSFLAPTGVYLVSKDFDGDSLTTDPEGEWVYFEFDTLISLAAEVTYAIDLRAPNSGPGGESFLMWRRDLAAGYTRGKSWLYIVAWVSSNIDLMFEEWGYAL